VANLYSIAHEALMNVSKHSKICEATVRLNLDKNLGSLEIEDHGMGFDPESILHEGGHLGLVGMYERATEIGWDLTLRSRPGEGTRIVVSEREPQP
jgi:signal transduction histidine kinase